MACVDIIMPLYNKAYCVERSIRSIQYQTFTDWKLIIVNDGSTDNSAETVRKIEDPRIELLHQSNKGPGAARNRGIAHATSRFVAFLDADDEWYPWYLANALDAIQNNDVALVATTYYEWPKKVDTTRLWAKRKVYTGRYSLTATEDPAWADFLLCFLHVGNSLIYTEVAKKYDGFYAEHNCRYSEDTTFFMRVGINECFLIIGPPAVRHHREDSDLSNTADFPLAPFLIDPEVVLRYCPADKRNFMCKVLDHFALRTAQSKARHGFKKDAIALLKRFPGVASYRWMYYQCLVVIALSRWFPYWVRIRCALGPRIRLFIKSLAWKLHIIPRIPEVQEQEKYT
jgi:glycosyltransferase involved in cell wall biosynthesis